MTFQTMLLMLARGFLQTLVIFSLTLVGSLPLGILVALARMSKIKPLSFIMGIYISFMRGTPLMLQLMFFMFAPYYLFGMPLGADWKFYACGIGFILNYAAYFAGRRARDSGGRARNSHGGRGRWRKRNRHGQCRRRN